MATPTEHVIGSVVNGPVISLLEVLLHELSNPVQAARTTLNLMQADLDGHAASRARIANLDAAFERIAAAVLCVQSVKESALRSPVPVLQRQVLEDIKTELTSLGLHPSMSGDLHGEYRVVAHEVAIPVLAARWAAAWSKRSQGVVLSQGTSDGEWRLNIELREGDDSATERDASREDTAGYAAALGQFLLSSGGRAILSVDHSGEFALQLCFALAR
ncbi:MAG: hypothetical protein H6506_04630 [Calditrichaeota bacterium]|nr:hypothetical protein [Calditrichota bacterium]MCB9366767.1 hypothetical protein [Calditrichota bacterium]MCB9391920.1 hypothetical protein [Calditrichota bacterium]